uniref:Putative ATPase domain containing protein n=1 Tax=viral metagenome TaxID=1070528 RepID=A0A6M3LQ61_9ZZZZ
MTPLDVVKATDLSYGKGFYVSALLTGPAGSGKTTGALSMPGRKLLLDSDQGREVTMGRQDVDIVSISEPDPASPRGWLDAQKIRKEISSQVARGVFPYDVVIDDSITRKYELGLLYVMLMDSKRGDGGTPVSSHWMAQKKEMMVDLEFYIHAPFHYIATVHEVAEKDELLGSIQYWPAITGKDSERVVRRFREVYHCFSVIKGGGEDARAEFKWRTMKEAQREYLKSSMNTDQKYWGAVVPQDFRALITKRGIKLVQKEAPSEKTSDKSASV